MISFEDGNTFTVISSVLLPTSDGEILYICLNRKFILIRQEKGKEYIPFKIVGFHKLDDMRELQVQIN